MRRRSDDGFTLIEAAIAVVVIAALVVFVIGVLQNQERRRLNALAHTKPGEVFELHAQPLKEEFSWDEEIALSCEFVNPNDYQLLVPELMGAALTIGDRIIATGHAPIGYQMFMKPGERLTTKINLKTELPVTVPVNQYEFESTGYTGKAELTFYGYGHHSSDLKDGAFSRFIVPGAPVLRSEEIEITIGPNFPDSTPPEPTASAHR